MGNKGCILVKHLLIGCATARRTVVVDADNPAPNQRQPNLALPLRLWKTRSWLLPTPAS